MMSMRSVLLLSSLLTLATSSAAGEVKIPFSYMTSGGANGGFESVTDYISVPVTAVHGVMQVKVGDIATDMELIPAQALWAALKAHKQAPKFRVTWEVSVLHLNFRSTVLYDRKAKTLKYYQFGSSGIGDGFGRFRNQAMMAKVTDKVLQQLAMSKKVGTRAAGAPTPLDAETAGFTTYLTIFGAQVIWSKNERRKG